MTEERYGYEEIANKPINNEGLKELFTKQRQMTEEQKQKFRELFPEYTVKDSEVCLSPYIDIFEAGIEIATKELEAQIEKLKQDLDTARENANRQEQWEIYSVLNDIYNDNFEVITSVSN